MRLPVQIKDLSKLLYSTVLWYFTFLCLSSERNIILYTALHLFDSCGCFSDFNFTQKTHEPFTKRDALVSIKPPKGL